METHGGGDKVAAMASPGGSDDAVRSGNAGTQGPGAKAARMAAARAARAAWRAKWPPEVRHVNQNNNRAVRPFVTVFEGNRALVLPDRRLPFEWRSLASVGFWVTARDAPVFFGKTLTEGTLKLAEWAMTPDERERLPVSGPQPPRAGFTVARPGFVPTCAPSRA